MAKKHIINYHKAMGLELGDFIACERCQGVGVDCHHVRYGRHNRSDEIDNLCVLCRPCHLDAHGVNAKAVKEELLTIINNR